MSLQEFLAMGGHAFYVWSSFGAVAVVMIYHWIVPVIRHRRLLGDLQQQIAAEKRSRS